MRFTLFRRVAAVWLLALVAAGVFAGISPALCDVQVTGRVLDPQGAPVPKAAIYAEKRGLAPGVFYADESGSFSIQVNPSETSELVFIFDDQSTPGLDYLPKRAKVPPASPMDVVLTPCGAVRLVGDIQFIETESLPTATTFTVTDASGIPLTEYGLASSLTPIYVLPRSQPDSRLVLVPAGSAFHVRAKSTVLIDNKLQDKVFDVDPKLVVGRGELVEFDVFPRVVSANRDAARGFLGAVKDSMEDLEGKGFYLTREKSVIAGAERDLGRGEESLSAGEYRAGYGLLKIAYIALRNTRNDLGKLESEASLSVYLITGFLAVGSVGAGFLCSSNLLLEGALSAAFFGVSAGLLYVVYPGTGAISRQSFTLNSAAIFVALLVVSILLPRFLGKIRGGSQTSYLAVIVPVFSIAKRNLTRRRLRFALTLTTVTVLVMSFVALTSFSEAYGLTVSGASRQPEKPGVLIRATDWSSSSQSFILYTSSDQGWLRGQAEVSGIYRKLQNNPATRPILSLGRVPINGVIGIDPGEDKASGLAECLVEGRLPANGEAAVSESLRSALGAGLGSKLQARSTQLTIVGVFGDAALARLRDMDGEGYLPDRMVNINPPGEPPAYIRQVCEPVDVLFMGAGTVEALGVGGLSRLSLTLREGADAVDFAERLALERGYQAWASTASGITRAALSSYLEGKGLPLVVPWGIVVLNMVVTMLNALYERRREISILSSVGLNPAEIASIFVAEAGVTGFIGGGVGYLLGLILYQVMPMLGLALEVHMKVSVFWSLASVGIAITAVLAGALIALRSSVVITPSLTRKWRIEGETHEINAPWMIPIPLKLAPSEAEPFADYLVNELDGMLNGDPRKTSRVKKLKEEDTVVVTFSYMSTQVATGNFFTKNRVLLAPGEGGVYGVTLESRGDREWSHLTGSLIRQIVMEWSNRRR